MHVLRTLTPHQIMRWPLFLVLCVMTAQAESPVPRPAIARDWSISPAPGYSLDARRDRTDVAAQAGLIGYWEHRSPYGTISLEIVSSEQIVVSGQEMKYELVPGVIRLLGEFEEIEYRYQLTNDRLILTLADGQEKPRDIAFRRVNLSESEPYLPRNVSSQ